jgi:hypothetical protein
MYAFFLVCFVIVCSCIGASYQHNVFGSKLLFFDKRDSPLAGRCERIPHEKRVVPHGFSSHSSDLSPLALSGIPYLGRHEFGLNGLTKGQKYAIIPNATQEYYNIFLRKTHGLLLAQLIRVSFVLLQTNRITSFLFYL